MRNAILHAFLVCEVYVVLFIALHDWIPLGRLNNLRGIRAVDPAAKRLAVTALSTLPFAVGLAASVHYADVGFPRWLLWFLWCSYATGLYGILRAWWLPYLLIPDPARAARYRARFENTHAFLPARNGIRPDTLHAGFHGVFLIAVILLGALSTSR